MADNEKGMYPVSVIAEVLMLSERRVQQLARAGIIPKPVNGRYSFIESVQGYLKFLKARADESRSDHKERLLKAQADKAEIELSRIESELIPAKAAEKAWKQAAAAVSEKLLALPLKMARAVQGARELPEIEARLKEQVYKTLSELAAKGN